MRIDELTFVSGARKDRKRVGRGDGSGRGTYSGRGRGGQKSRAGFKMRPGFEGGQLPLIKRLPRKRGFTNIFRTEYSVVNVGKLDVFEAGSEITPGNLLGSGLVRSLRYPIKILAGGDISQALTIKVHKVTAAARAKIEAAGGSIEEVTVASETDQT